MGNIWDDWLYFVYKFRWASTDYIFGYEIVGPK